MTFRPFGDLSQRPSLFQCLCNSQITREPNSSSLNNCELPRDRFFRSNQIGGDLWLWRGVRVKSESEKWERARAVRKERVKLIKKETERERNENWSVEREKWKEILFLGDLGDADSNILKFDHDGRFGHYLAHEDDQPGQHEDDGDVEIGSQCLLTLPPPLLTKIICFSQMENAILATMKMTMMRRRAMLLMKMMISFV